MKNPEFWAIGSASTEQKQEVQEQIRSNLCEHDLDRFLDISPLVRKGLKESEISKSEEQIAVINIVNAESNKIMTELGLDPYDVPLQNYHLIPSQTLDKVAMLGDAFAYYTEQGVLFRKEDFDSNQLKFASVALHETLHLKGRIAVEAQEINGEVESEMYRSGVLVRKRDKPSNLHREAERSLSFLDYMRIKLLGGTKNKENTSGHQSTPRSFKNSKPYFYFDGLNEAIISMMQKRLHQDLLNEPIFSVQKDWLESPEIKERKRAISEQRGIPETEIMWVGKDESDVELFSYPKQRKVLEYICEEVQKELPRDYANVDEVFKEFMRSHFTGRLLTIGRIIDKTFGKGSLKRISGMRGRRDDSAEFLLEELRKKRQEKQMAT